MTVVMLAATLSLGVWQVRRLAWKEALLADIDRAEQTAPSALSDSPEPFARVFVEGTFAKATALYGTEVRSGPAGPVMGAYLITPLVRPGAPPLLVNRGWAPSDAIPPSPEGTVRVEGYIRSTEHPHWFDPADDPAQRRFFSLDVQSIGAALGFNQVAPVILVATGRASIPPEPAEHLPRPPNNHLSYALTWFGLAGALTVIFGLYAVQTLKNGRTP